MVVICSGGVVSFSQAYSHPFCGCVMPPGTPSVVAPFVDIAEIIRDCTPSIVSIHPLVYSFSIE